MMAIDGNIDAKTVVVRRVFNPNNYMVDILGLIAHRFCHLCMSEDLKLGCRERKIMYNHGISLRSKINLIQDTHNISKNHTT